MVCGGGLVFDVRLCCEMGIEVYICFLYVVGIGVDEDV